MMKQTVKLLLLSLVLLSVSACKPDEIIEYPIQPAGYQELLAIYKAQSKYLYSDFEEQTTIYFEDSKITIPTNGMVINDCRDKKPDVVSLSEKNKMWCINGQLCGVKYHNQFSDEQATLVYAYVDLHTLHMYLSNGTVLDFPFDESVLPKTFQIPMVKITHNGNQIYRDDYINGTITIEDPDKAYSDNATFTADMKIKGRGRSSWDMPKKPYKFKLNSKESVLGLSKEKSWCLIANYSDKSLLRNMLGMEISRICGMAWTPDAIPVELSINGNYMGVYNLFDDKGVSTNRVNISDTDYYLEVEEAFDEPLNFYSKYGVPIQIKEPETATNADLDIVKNYVRNFEEALEGADFADPQKGYAAWIDVDSFINNFIIRELAKDIDGNMRKSTFMTLQKDKKLDIYFVWDFDLSFGNADYFPDGNNGPTGWWVKDYNSYSQKNAGWYYRLFQDPAFAAKVKDRWNELYPKLERIPLYIDKVAAEMGDAPSRNFKKWDILNTYVWPNVRVTGSYEGEIEYLKYFYTGRLGWLNKNINEL